MTRKFPGRSPKRSSTSNCDIERSRPSGENQRRRSFNFKPSVHSTNLYIASRPVVILFEYVSFGIHRLFYLFLSAIFFVWGPIRAYCSTRQKNYVDLVREEYKISFEEEHLPGIMASGGLSCSMKGSPGLGDPLLARQKEHHRKAFDFISKALRIDEENIPGT